MLSRFRMDVLCASVAEAVEHAGGLICDRSLMGWDVSVFARGEDCALQILGAKRAEGTPQDPATQELLRAVVVSGNLYRNDDGIRRWVDQATDQPRIEVLIWETDWATADVGCIEIPVSRAALVFVGHARAAVGCEPSSETAELYRQLRTGRIHRAGRHPHVLTTANGV